MRRTITLGMMLGFALVATSCGNTLGNNMGINVSPPDAAVNQPLVIDVTVGFGSSVTPEVSWMDSVSLLKNDAGPTLCLDVLYNPNTNVATCLHDPLEPNTSYTTSLIGLGSFTITGRVDYTWSTGAGTATAAQTLGADAADGAAKAEGAETGEEVIKE